MKLALWANEPKALHAEAPDMLFVMGKLDFSLILLFGYLHLNCDICIEFLCFLKRENGNIVCCDHTVKCV